MRYLWKYSFCVLDLLAIAYYLSIVISTQETFEKVWFIAWTVVIGVFFLDSLVEGVRLHVKYLAKQEKEEEEKHA